MAFISRIQTLFNALAQLFESKSSRPQPGFFGLGQFVLLICIAPFIFDLHLYGLGTKESKPSAYEFDPYRFESLPDIPGVAKAPSRPRAPKPLNKTEYNLLTVCASSAFFSWQKACKQVAAKNKKYQNKNRSYKQKLANYRKQANAYRVRLEKNKDINKKYQNFTLNLEHKPAQEKDIVRETSQTLTSSVTSSLALDTWNITGPILWFIGLVLIIPTLMYAAQKRCWSLLLFGLSVPTYNYLITVLGFGISDGKLTPYYLNNAVLSQVAFAWFICKGQIRSRSFFLFLATLCLSVSFAVSSGVSERSVVQANLPVLIFIIASCLLKFIYLVFRDNVYLIHQKGILDNLKTLAHALYLWLPIGLFAIGAYFITNKTIPSSLTQSLHGNGILIYDSDHDFLDNSLQSVASATDDAAYNWHLIIESMRIDIQKKSKALAQKNLTQFASETFDKIMPQKLAYSAYESNAVPIMKEGIEIAVNAAQDATQAAYMNLRLKMKSALIRTVTEQENKIKTALSEGKEAALTTIDQTYEIGIERLMNLSYITQKSLWWIISTFEMLMLIELLILIFIGSKSLLYVFARVRFNSKSELAISIAELKSEKLNGNSIRNTGLNYVFPDEPNTYFVSRKYQCRGSAPNFALPQTFSCFFARWSNSSLSMNRISISENSDTVTCTATRGMEFFEWNLSEGEQVAFDFYNFVGMSHSVKLATVVSTRISSLLLGKLFYSVATGPGKLILLAEGRAQVTEDLMSLASLPPERIIACHLHSKFYIDSKIDLKNIYMSSAYVKPTQEGDMIIDVDSLRGVKSGVGGFLRRFVLPL